jgi:hypothetical protein
MLILSQVGTTDNDWFIELALTESSIVLTAGQKISYYRTEVLSGAWTNEHKFKVLSQTALHNLYSPGVCILQVVMLLRKVVTSIPVADTFPWPTVTPISDSFSPICAHPWNYSQGCNQCKCMTWLKVTGYYSLHGNGYMEMDVVYSRK